MESSATISDKKADPIEKLRDCFMHEVLDDSKPPQSIAIFVPPQGSHAQGDDPKFKVLDQFQQFLKSKKQHSLLLLAESGMGKTTTSLYFINHLWRTYTPGSVVPIYLYLPLVPEPVIKEGHLLQHCLKECGIKEEEILALLRRERFLILLDGFEEIEKLDNLYQHNRWDESHVKLITTARPEALPKRMTSPHYASLFYPPKRADQPLGYGYQEIWLCPFTLKQQAAYLAEYAKLCPRVEFGVVHKELRKSGKIPRDNWEDPATYYRYFDKIHKLSELAQIPLLLSMIARILPALVTQAHTDSKPLIQLGITRTQIYDRFVAQQFARYQKTHSTPKSCTSTLAGYLQDYLRTYAENLAYHQFQQGRLDMKIEAQATEDVALLRPRQLIALSDDERADLEVKEQSVGQRTLFYQGYLLDQEKKHLTPDVIKTIRSGCLLEAGKGYFRFSHKPLAVYFAAQHLLTSFSPDIALADIAKDKTFALNAQLLVHEPDILQILADNAIDNPAIRERLFALIDATKKHPHLAIAGANAATILNQARAGLNHLDWRGVHIPGADLTMGLLTGTDFSRANLRGATLAHARLDYTRWQNTQCHDINLGERVVTIPYARAHMECVAYAHDGTRLAVGFGPLVYVLDAKTQAHIAKLQDHYYGGHGESKYCAYSIAFHPKKHHIVAAGFGSGRLCIWDLKQKKTLQILKGHTGWVKALAYAPDGKQLASGSDDKNLRLWDPITGRCTHTLRKHTKNVSTLAYSPDGKQLASGGEDQTLCFWNPATGRCTQASRVIGPVIALAYAPDGKRLALVSRDFNFKYAISLWDSATKKWFKTLEGSGTEMLALAYSPDGKQLACGDRGGTIRLWDPITGKCIGALLGHQCGINTVAYSPDGKQLASSSWDDTLRLWDSTTKQNTHQLLTGHKASINALAFIPDSQQLVSGGNDYAFSRSRSDSKNDDSTLRLWDPVTGRCTQTLAKHKDSIAEAARAFELDGKQIADEGWEEPFLLTRLRRIPTNSITALACAPDGKQLVSGRDDGRIRLWDPITEQRVKTLEGHENRVYGLTYAPNGKRLISAGLDGTLRLWDSVTGECLKLAKGKKYAVRTLAYAPSGKQLAGGSWEGPLYLWDPATGRCTQTLAGHKKPVNALAYSPDGKQLASGAEDSTLRLWDPATGCCIQTLTGHKADVNTLSYAPDGKQLASGSKDFTLRLWDLDAYRCVCTMPWCASITAVQYTDAQHIAVGDKQGSLSYWEILKHDKTTTMRLLWYNRGQEPLWIGRSGAIWQHRGKDPSLTAKGMQLQNPVGLSEGNRALLKQRGAVEKPLATQAATLFPAPDRREAPPDRQAEDSELAGRAVKLGK